MRKSIIILLCFISLSVSAQFTDTLWVTPRGNDTNTGQDSSSSGAWLTWTKAFATADAGDLVYIRGGVYISENERNHPRIDPYGYIYTATGHIGTKANPIAFRAYPPDYESGNFPILDCKNHIPYEGGSIIHGITISQTEYVQLKGLTIRNLWQRGLVNLPVGILILLAENLTFENCTIHDVSGRGVGGDVIVGYLDALETPNIITQDSTYWINCDFYNLCDSTSANPGNAADGIKVTLNGRTSTDYPHSYWKLTGCRFWNFSDDGTDIGGPGQVIHENCWSSSTSKFAPLGIEGNGFKAGGIDWSTHRVPADSLLTTNWRIFRNCIAVNCNGFGYYDVDYIPYFRTRSLYYNNIAYNDTVGFSAMNNHSFRPRNTIYKNNIVYESNKYENGIYVQVEIGSNTAPAYPESHNTWDAFDPSPGSWPFFHITDTVTLNIDDFVSVNADQLFAARDSTGKQPDVTTFRLTGESDLIAAGINVGMSATPDIGIDWSYYDLTYGAGEEAPAETNAPTVYSNSATSIKSVDAVTGGNITSDGGATITARGIVWGTSANPTLSNNVITVSGTTGSFTVTLTGLSSNTTYHARSYATNSAGTSYGADVSFTTKEYTPIMNGTLIMIAPDGKTIVISYNEKIYDYDGNEYIYAIIGNQQWMTKNYRCTKYADGTPIPNLTLAADWIADATGAYCSYDNNASNIQDYGLLYNSYAVENAHGLAPAGWRVPTQTDIETLVSYIGGESVGGGKLKTAGLNYWDSPNTGATNEYDFNGVGAGYRLFSDGIFESIKSSSFIWSTTPAIADPNNRYAGMVLQYNNNSVSSNDNTNRENGFSVRLMRDN